MVARAGDEGSAGKANKVLVKTVFRGEAVVRTFATRCQYMSKTANLKSKFSTNI